MKKTNLELIAWARSMVGHPYIYGSYGQTLTAAIVDRCGSYYSKQMTAARCKVAKEKYLGKKTIDCNGLFKSLLWGADKGEPTYDASTDWSAATMYDKAKDKGTMLTMPKEVTGLAVFNKSKTHVGVWDAEKQIVIEAKGFDYGVRNGKLSDFYYWAKDVRFEYVEGKVVEPVKKEEPKKEATKSISQLAGEVIDGKWGNDPERTKKLTEAGYDAKAVQAEVNKKLGVGTSKKPTGGYKGVVRVETALNIRKEPNGSIVGIYPKWDKNMQPIEVTILEEKDGWGRTDRGWVFLKYIEKV